MSTFVVYFKSVCTRANISNGVKIDGVFERLNLRYLQLFPEADTKPIKKQESERTHFVLFL
jgi:hypothetical protein